MSYKFFVVVLLFFFASFVNCTSTKTYQVLQEEYQSPSKNFNASITILPFTEDFVDQQVLEKHLSKEGSAKSVVSTTNKNIYKNYFGLVFSETITGKVNDLLSSSDLELVEEPQFIDTTFTGTSNRAISLIAPQGGKLYNESNPTDYTLLTQSLRWELEYVESQSRPVGGNVQKQVDFKISFKYLLWDNNRERIVGYGVINEKRILAKFPNRGFYIQFFEELSKLIVNKSPMQIRYS